MAIFDFFNNYDRQQMTWQSNQNNRRPRPGYFQTRQNQANAGYGRAPMAPNNANASGQTGGNWLSNLLRGNNSWLGNTLKNDRQWQNNRNQSGNQFQNQPQNQFQQPFQNQFQQPMQGNQPQQPLNNPQNNRQPMNFAPQQGRQQPFPQGQQNNQQQNNPQQRSHPQNNYPQNNNRTGSAAPQNSASSPFQNMFGGMQQQPQTQPQPMNNQTRPAAPQPSIPQQIPPEVSFEPISDDMLKMIRKNVPNAQTTVPMTENTTAQAVPPTKQFFAPQPENIAAPIADADEYTAKLEDFIQSEKNASAFYRKLSGLSASNIHRELFNKISEEDNSFSDRYNEIYQQHKGARFEAQSMPVPFVESLSFADGIQLAIQEEYKTLDDLNTFYERAQDEKNRDYYNTVRTKKMRDIDLMHAVLADM